MSRPSSEDVRVGAGSGDEDAVAVERVVGVGAGDPGEGSRDVGGDEGEVLLGRTTTRSAAEACPTPRPARSTTRKVIAPTATTTASQRGAGVGQECGQRRIPTPVTPFLCSSVPTVPRCSSSRTTRGSGTSLVRALTERGHAVATAATGMGGLERRSTSRPTWCCSTSGCPTSTARR